MKPKLRNLWPAICATAWLSACGTDESAAPPAGDTPPPAPAAEATAEPDLDARLAAADPRRGRTLFLQCRACHSLGEGEPHKVGPNLHGMFGRQAGTAPGFSYSDAVANSGIVWDPETLDKWLARPSDFLPGNRMVFVGIKDPQDRANLIVFLQRETGAAE